MCDPPRQTQPSFPRTSVAVIGAGVAGLACAQRLAAGGMDVQVLEKSRGVGGRMATRRADRFQFDHGTQYFTVRDPRFREFIDTMIAAGAVRPWNPRIVILQRGDVVMEEEPKQRYVGVPGMNGICRKLADSLSLELNTLVAAADRHADGWRLLDEQGRTLGLYDILLTSAPAPQTAALMTADPAMVRDAESARMVGCWAGMFAFSRPLPLEFDGSFVMDSPLNWIASNGSKPQRDADSNTWVVHASSEWSRENIDRQPSVVLPQLLEAFWAACGLEPCKPLYAAAHRWRYALAARSLATQYLYNSERRVGACGDWCWEPRVEGAYLSGVTLAEPRTGHPWRYLLWFRYMKRVWRRNVFRLRSCIVHSTQGQS